MKSRGWILFESPEGWQIGRMLGDQVALDDVPIALETPEEEVAALLAQRLKELGYSGQSIILGVSSQRCLPANLPLDEHTTRRDYRTLNYALEEQFPPDIEDVVVDFVFAEDQVLGIATPIAGLRGLVTALELCGITVHCITPASLLALQQVEVSGAAESAETVLWQADDQVEIFLLAKGKPKNWMVVDNSQDEVVRCLRYLKLTGQHCTKASAFQLAPGIVESLQECDDFDLVQSTPDKQMRMEAVRAAPRIVAGERRPWIEFRRGELAPQDKLRSIRRPLTFATAGAICLLLATSVGLLWRAWQYDRLAQQSVRRQEASYARVFPDSRVPTGIRSRLESEKSKLAGLTGNRSEIPEYSSALLRLREFLEALPGDLQFRILDLRIEGQGQIHVEGEVLKHGDAGAIVAAMREQGIQADNPRSEQLSAGLVSFRFDATAEDSEAAL